MPPATAAMASQENAGVNAGPVGGAAAGPRALSAGELKGLLGQCLKMASENKITPQNTWGLPLIEHLEDLIKEGDPAASTNFQRASVTLDAGVKIYSYRVDSVHTETFKILGGLGRASGPSADFGDGGGDPGDGGDGGEEGARRRRRAGGDPNPEATLEPSLDALNVKKFDLAFAVDPLFHKTSAQFDEGGARGLLLANLSVYRGCEIVFDSMDVPETAVDAAPEPPRDAEVDLSGVSAQLEALRTLGGGERISPALDDILALLGAAPAPGAAAAADRFVARVAELSGEVGPLPSLTAAPSVADASGMASGGTAAAPGGEEGDSGAPAPPAFSTGADYDDSGGYDDGPGYDDGGYGGGDDDSGDDGGGGGQLGAAREPGAAPFSASRQAGGGGGGGNGLGEDALQWLIAAGTSSYVTGSKGWAGASHWRYRAPPAPGGVVDGDDDEADSGAQGAAKKRKAGVRRKNDPLDFAALMAEGGTEPEFELLPPAPPRPTRKARPAAKTLLPEDHHYKAEMLGRYALRPSDAVRIGSGGGCAEASARDGAAAFDADGYGGGYDDGGGYGDDGDDDGGDYGGGDAYGSECWGGDAGAMAAAFESISLGGEGGLGLVEAARKVAKVEVSYSRAAKAVDVKALKELIWAGIAAVRCGGGGSDGVLDFQAILATLPERNAAGRLEDLSVHLCFICALHLANEHGLAVRGVPGMDRMLISNLPAAA